MTEQERDRLIEQQGQTTQAIYHAMCDGRAWTARQLHEPTGRTDGMTNELRKLQQLGLIRLVGQTDPKDPDRRGMAANLYKIVAMGEVEQAARTFKTRRSRRRSPQQRMREIRVKETGDYAIWYRVRRRLLECAGLLIDMDKMTFWDAIPDDELDTIVDELGELQQWTEAVLEGIGQRYSDDRLRAKIAALRETSGRTPAEIETASRLASKLEGKL
jgi:hypothetical protein